VTDADDPRARFTVTAADYHRHRPTYPPPLFDWIEARVVRAPLRVADVGCGTGIATRLLAARGHDVVGVDPNQAMLEQAREAGGPARYLRGEAGKTGLPDASVDLVTVAQAFHWFELPAALAEFGRILEPGGACAAFWNLRGSTPFLDAYDRLLRQYSSEYESIPKGGPTLERLASRPEVTAPERARFENLQRLDRDGLHSRVRSSSYVAHGVRDTAGFVRELDALFDRHAAAGTIDFVYRTEALLFRIAPRA
jgi:SAM-dependent methyltransferase